jgi:hypothetical protein
LLVEAFFVAPQSLRGAKGRLADVPPSLAHCHSLPPRNRSRSRCQPIWWS